MHIQKAGSLGDKALQLLRAGPYFSYQIASLLGAANGSVCSAMRSLERHGLVSRKMTRIPDGDLKSGFNPHQFLYSIADAPVPVEIGNIALPMVMPPWQPFRGPALRGTRIVPRPGSTQYATASGIKVW